MRSLRNVVFRHPLTIAYITTIGLVVGIISARGAP